MKKILGMSLASAVLLSGCGGGASSSASSGGGVVSSAQQVSIDAMTSVPVINGSATQGTLYVHNYGTNAINGASFNLGLATTKTRLKTALANLGVKLGGYEDASGFILINPERCASIPAGGSCAVNFTTPNLSVGNLGNSLVKLSYSGKNGTQTTSQVVNYKYVDLAALGGVNFTGSLNVVGTQGSTQHVVGYVYAGGTAGTLYKDVNLKSTNATTSISNGFINGQEVAAGQVIAVEFAVGMQSNKSSYVNVTPSWGASKLQSTSVGSGTGNLLGLSLTPSQGKVNYIFGDIPVLTAPTGIAAVVNVTNNGNADGGGGLTARATSNASDLTIDYTDCVTTALRANAANSCKITFAATSSTPGSTTVEYVSNGSVIGSQTVVWTNDKPYPAVYISPNMTTYNLGKGDSGADDSITFTFTNVGKAPLTGITYPVTNSGPATWTEDSRTCTSTIGATTTPTATCSISGHLTGTDDGTGDLYIRALGSANSVNYSFVSLPIRYTVAAAPSLEITSSTSDSLLLLANGSDVVNKTYTVRNIGNDPAILNGINDSINLVESTTNNPNNLLPYISGGSCMGKSTLLDKESCSVTVTYGPASANLTANESGIATFTVNYSGGTPDEDRTSKSAFNYKLVGNDSYVKETTNSNMPYDPDFPGTYQGKANMDQMTITTTYENPSQNYPMTNFNLNTNNLPYGVVVDPDLTTCAIGSQVMSLEMNEDCKLVLKLDRSLLATAGGSVNFNFTIPTATWTTPLGFYSQPGDPVRVNYAQPVVTFVLSANNANFKSTILTMTGSSLDKGATSLPVSIAGVKYWLESSPINPTSNCPVNSSTYAVDCNLTEANNVGSVTYVMPNYLQTGEKADIPLIFSTSAYAYLSPSYTFINYLFTAPVPPIVATVNLPQTGQTPTLPVNPALVGMDGYTYIGVPWAYVTSGATTTPTTRFTVDPADANCIIDHLTGLEWIKSPSSTTYEWRTGTAPNYTYPAQVAVDGYNTANTCGYTDWYLPTVNDLASLLNDGEASPATWLNLQGFSNVRANVYWSSSTFATNPNVAWYVNFLFNGSVGAGGKGNLNYVWPVRLAQ